MIVLGATLILAPVVKHGVSTSHDRERIAEFYQRNPNNALLPVELRPSDYAGYDWVCFGTGVAFASVGVKRTGKGLSGKPKAIAEV